MGYLMSPFMIEDMGQALSDFGQVHTGVGFIHKKAGLHVTTQFLADDYINGNFVAVSDRAGDALTFGDGGALLAHEGKIDLKFWQHTELMATISGADYKSYKTWLVKEAPKYTRYNYVNLRVKDDLVPETIIQTFEGEIAATRSITCFDASLSMLQAVKAIAPDKFVQDPLKVFRNDFVFWMKPGTEARRLDMTPGSIDSQKAAFYYEQLGKCFKPDDLLVPDQVLIDAIAGTGLDYAIHHDAIGNLWLYTPDTAVLGMALDSDHLAKILPLRAHHPIE